MLKPLYGNGGAGVFHIDRRRREPQRLLDLLAQTAREPLMIQSYIPESARATSGSC